MPRTVMPDRAEFVRAWHDKNIRRTELSQMFSCSSTKLSYVARHFGLNPQRPKARYYTQSRVIDPTPEEIRQRCEEIRAGWSETRLLADVEGSLRIRRNARLTRRS